MKIASLKAALGGNSACSEISKWEERDAPPELVASHLAAGMAIAPLQSLNVSQAKFVGADWVFVKIEGFQQHTQELLDHPFTVKHASVACVSDKDGSLATVIGFVLPQRIVSHTAYREVQVGLALLYNVPPTHNGFDAS